MSFFEEINESNSILKKLLHLLRPLGMITGGGSNRLSVDINAVGSLPTLGTVNTVNALNNQVNTGGVNSFAVAKDTSRLAYNTGIRQHLTFQ
jgi:hypothetical protein